MSEILKDMVSLERPVGGRSPKADFHLYHKNENKLEWVRIKEGNH